MASKTVTRALRASSRQALTAAQRPACRPLSTAAKAALFSAAARPAVARAAATARVGVPAVQSRGLKTIDFAGVKEDVYERADWPREKLLNGASWKEAIEDGWVPGKNLFDINEAIGKGTIVMNLLSDAAQSETWPSIKPLITKGKTLYFSHGFSPVFKDLTKVEVPTDVDVILVAPKGSGRTVRSLFKEGRGINSSIAVFQDVTGKAEEKAVALGVAVGSGYLYKTTFEKEVYSDLYGERGCLMGGIHGMFLAQYEVLRENGHSPSEAFNETVEEATQSLYPLIGKNGMDWMYEACSTTARRGAIDWSSRFKDSLKPVFQDLYDSVKTGKETQRSLDFNGQADYRAKFEKEMQEIRDLEIWRAGKAVRSLRPENQQ
ncbi:mitochondrial ketol-acid reductoisomerase [Drechslerella stenobrocha 248]|uniref:Ketol-acid reductoisomerase, mitochondrial n=1 Tax=Drechslerella stenobrocha 248 TaxID=1043628 RepID=W7IBX6_9PEZI|nr:mitochondrial ketol-acid reductoisomerase [Drechslerella stenobrocha 248]